MKLNDLLQIPPSCIAGGKKSATHWTADRVVPTAFLDMIVRKNTFASIRILSVYHWHEWTNMKMYAESIHLYTLLTHFFIVTTFLVDVLDVSQRYQLSPVGQKNNILIFTWQVITLCWCAPDQFGHGSHFCIVKILPPLKPANSNMT